MLAGLGAALYAHGSYEDGAQRVCDASDLNPSDPQPYLFLGKMEQGSPRPLPCVKEKLARFAHDQHDNAWASYYYAISLLKPDDGAQSKEAERLLENAVRLNPKFASAYLQLGVLKSNGGDWQSAKESYERAAASDPMLPDPHFRLAQVYKRLGDERKASEELQIFESLKKSDAASVEQQRREIRQFVVVMKGAASTPAHPAQTQ
jgi:Tfp pilus assembly protein PilF